MMSDVAEARPLSPGSGEGRPVRNQWRRRERASHHRAGLPDHRLTIAALVTLGGVCVQRDLRELDPAWLELDVWLARSLRRYAARNVSIEKTVRRDSM
jgi:hypothetical protein